MFFFKAMATSEIYTYCHTLSLHDALPISLLDPKWKGKLAWRDNSDSGSALFVTNIMMTMGDQKGEEYLKKLAKQKDRKSTRLLQSLMRISYAVFCLKKKTQKKIIDQNNKL